MIENDITVTYCFLKLWGWMSKQTQELRLMKRNNESYKSTLLKWTYNLVLSLSILYS